MITLFKLILQINSVISPFLEDIMGILPKNENENLINQTHIEEYTLPLPEPLPEPVTNSPTDNKDTLIMIGKGVIIVVGVTLIIYLIYKIGFSGDGAAPAAPAATHGIAPLVPLVPLGPLVPTNIVSTCLIIPGTLNPLPLSNLTTFALNYPYIVGLLPSNPLNPLFSAKLAFAATVLADNAAPIIGHIVTPLLDVAANELAITPVFDPIPPVSDPIPPVSDPIPPVSDPISSLYLPPGVDLVDYLHINLSEYSEKERQIIKAIVKLIIKYESPSTSLAIKEEILEIIARLTNKQYLLYERAADIYYLRM